MGQSVDDHQDRNTHQVEYPGINGRQGSVPGIKIRKHPGRKCLNDTAADQNREEILAEGNDEDHGKAGQQSGGQQGQGDPHEGLPPGRPQDPALLLPAIPQDLVDTVHDPDAIGQTGENLHQNHPAHGIGQIQPEEIHMDPHGDGRSGYNDGEEHQDLNQGFPREGIRQGFGRRDGDCQGEDGDQEGQEDGVRQQLGVIADGKGLPAVKGEPAGDKVRPSPAGRQAPQPGYDDGQEDQSGGD